MTLFFGSSVNQIRLTKTVAFGRMHQKMRHRPSCLETLTTEPLVVTLLGKCGALCRPRRSKEGQRPLRFLR